MPDDTRTGPARLIPPALVDLVTTGESRRARRWLGAYTGAVAVGGLLHEWRDRRDARQTYAVSVPATDDLYPELHRWLLTQARSAEHRSLIVKTRRRGHDEPVMEVGQPNRPRPMLELALTTGQSAEITIGGHPIRAEVEQPATTYGSSDASDPWRRWSDEKIVFRTSSRAARDAVIAWLEERAAEQRQTGPRLQVVDQWGDLRGSVLRPRQLDTVALPAQQKKRIVADLEWFLSAEADHARLGLPWHRGYLFHGIPGSGKTTMARALATHFGLDLAYLPLASVRGDLSLLRILLNCEPRSIVLIEDVDIVQASHERDADQTPDGLTLQGLLNGLDGVATPHGLITICTTNHPEVLDAALTRPGRLDVSEEFGELDWDTLGDLVRILDAGPLPEQQWATGRAVRPASPDVRWRLTGLTAAQVIEAAKPFMGLDREHREMAIRELLEDNR